MENTNILDSASKVEVLHPGNTAIDTFPVVSSSLDFADPSDINTMIEQLGIHRDTVLYPQNIAIMKELSALAKASEVPVYDLISHIGSIVGGRFSENYPAKVYAYAKLVMSEKEAENRLDSIRAQKDSITL